MFQSLDDQVVPNVVEERADIHFQYPVLTTAPNGTLTQSIVGRSSGPVPLVRMENRIDHSLHISFHCALGYGNRSTLVTSQMPVDKWHALIGDPTLGDAILDRLVHNAYRIELKGESMRRRATKLTTAGTSD